MHNMVTRRNLIATCGAFLTSACADPVLRNVYDAAKFLTVGMPDVEITRDIIDNIPYASISAKIGKGPRSLLILGRYAGEDLHWLSADNATVVTRAGRVTKTAGFPENLKGTSFLGPDPVAKKLHIPDERRALSRSVDIDKGNFYGLTINSHFLPIGEVEIVIAGLKLRTALFEEVNEAQTVNWNHSNYFWVDVYDGFVWKSVQHIARGFPPIDIEVLKPAA
jgi:hypothetical protein